MVFCKEKLNGIVLLRAKDLKKLNKKRKALALGLILISIIGKLKITAYQKIKQK